jgi:hypothetical protein
MVAAGTVKEFETRGELIRKRSGQNDRSSSEVREVLRFQRQGCLNPSKPR